MQVERAKLVGSWNKLDDSLSNIKTQTKQDPDYVSNLTAYLLFVNCSHKTQQQHAGATLQVYSHVGHVPDLAQALASACSALTDERQLQNLQAQHAQVRSLVWLQLQAPFVNVISGLEPSLMLGPEF